ncbi:hypothetical protein GK047_19585 [Paenibacillus sp. SYP-B3998]|uniref:Uncharacterized protein n=1 Tax=Paenibacillus sp. SYP-B3998 TaxID=2678564 RepID=A0A6G4A141_9BACL|nr:hypothetical protein [Paenibacillus sp. SYP-B3998]NEW08206.1 hypothetical protein [Paenibacillus sp. SYP-B3998]
MFVMNGLLFLTQYFQFTKQSRPYETGLMMNLFTAAANSDPRVGTFFQSVHLSGHSSKERTAFHPFFFSLRRLVAF